MKSKNVMISAFVAFLLILGITVAAWHNHSAYAQSKAKEPRVNAKEVMAKYTPPKNKSETSIIRKSRLKQMNVVSEAARVLNVLPINIMDEMKKGKTLVEIANEKGMSKTEFLQKLKDVETIIVDGAVKDGTITKEHGKAIKDGQKDRLTKSLSMKAVDVNDHQSMDMGN